MRRLPWLVLPASIVACNQLAGLNDFGSASPSEETGGTGGDDFGDGGGSSAGQGNLGGDSGFGDGGDGSGGGSTGGQGTGGQGTGGAVIPEGCDSIAISPASVAMIDNFEAGPNPDFAIPTDDNRSGRWVYDVWENEPSREPVPGYPSPGAFASGYFLTFYCDDTDSWCNSTWSPDYAWQWASLRVYLRGDGDQADCYDASMYEGISFYAKAIGAADIQISIGTPDASPGEGLIYAAATIELDDIWTEYVFPFDELAQPGWSTITAPFDPSRLLYIDIMVREVVSEGGGSGESLLPYQIHLDEVSFY